MPDGGYAIGEHDIILSFLDPLDEVLLCEKYASNKIYLARALKLLLHDEIVNHYQQLITSLSIATIHNGKTIRELLSNGRNEINEWWYNSFSFRDCESSVLYRNVLYAKIISSVIGNKDIKDITFASIPDDVVETFKRAGYMPSQGRFNKPKGILFDKAYLKILIRQIVLNAFVTLTNLKFYLLLKRFPLKYKETDAVKAGLSGFYEWSFNLNKEYEIVGDKYFKNFTPELEKQNIAYKYLCWFEPNTVPNQHYSIKELLSANSNQPNHFLVNREISLFDLVQGAFSLSGRILRAYKLMKLVHKTPVYAIDGIDTLALFGKTLFISLVSYENLKYSIMQKSFSKYFKRHPNLKLFMLFLEQFPFSKAVVNAASKNVKVVAMQHASYCEGKTFYYLDRVHEFNKSPIDGMMAPHPEDMIVMGGRNKALFESIGYHPENVLQLGSLRYQTNKGLLTIKSKKYCGGTFVILLPLSINAEIHVDLIQAVYAAVKYLKDMKLVIRNHPFRDIREEQWIRDHEAAFEFSNVTLDKDLEAADLIISSYSTVAEEGLLSGVPVIQWASYDFEGSPLFNDARTSTCASVQTLNKKIAEIKNNYSQFMPTDEVRNSIYTDYFSPSHDSAQRIGEYIKKQL